MKAVLLLGGSGSRLGEISKITNKHLLPVYDLPMLRLPLQTILDAKIDEILVIVSDPFGKDIVGYLKDGKHLGIKTLQYAFQDGNKGIAHALALAEDFADGGPLLVVLGDNLIDPERPAAIQEQVELYELFEYTAAKVFIKKVNDPRRFGCPRFDNYATIVSIDEKPSVPKSNYAVMGMYILPFEVFEILKDLSPSERGEFEITDALNHFIDRNKLKHVIFEGTWMDMGNPESLFKAAEYWRNKKLGVDNGSD